MYLDFLKTLAFFGRAFVDLGAFLQKGAIRFDSIRNRSQLIRKGSGQSLYRTKMGDLFWLNSTSCVDIGIIENGVFEPASTKVVQRLLNKGDIVLDVGANIGYYSVMMSKLVGDAGRVVCFEPTLHYQGVLKENIAVNKLKNVELYGVGLSDKESESEIQIGDNSATLHVPGGLTLKKSERIKLVDLDSFLEAHPLPKIDFIKVDVDGHEPLFLQGARRTLAKYRPVVLLEISPPHYLNAGYSVWEFYDYLKFNDYHIYHEDDLVEMLDKQDFLRKCGNFDRSTNIVITRRQIS